MFAVDLHQLQRFDIVTRDAKFRPGGPVGPPGFSHAAPGFCGARTDGARLTSGLRKAVRMYCVLATRFRALLERCWPGSMLGPPDFVGCLYGLGLAF